DPRGQQEGRRNPVGGGGPGMGRGRLRGAPRESGVADTLRLLLGAAGGAWRTHRDARGHLPGRRVPVLPDRGLRRGQGGGLLRRQARLPVGGSRADRGPDTCRRAGHVRRRLRGGSSPSARGLRARLRGPPGGFRPFLDKPVRRLRRGKAGRTLVRRGHRKM
ncbi:MAG: hypothetical protein AVDCRST_MAG02-2200, partial [uncultured Rubrobacteraceae bacterium]